MRAIPPELNPAIVANIDQRLASVEQHERVKILLAVESGSRAWGFPSPDSDYDCRFIYIRKMPDYLRLFPVRDVIETPMDVIYDVNGWDLAKTLKLLLKGNAVVIEWLLSPIVYKGSAQFRDSLRQLADKIARRDLIERHYLHLGLRQRNTYFADGKAVRLKKVFYALRPAMALRWLDLHPEQKLPPMNFRQLMQECDLPTPTRALLEGMLIEKATTHEMGSGEVPQPIADFIDTEFIAAQNTYKQETPLLASDIEAAEAFFLNCLTDR